MPNQAKFAEIQFLTPLGYQPCKPVDRWGGVKSPLSITERDRRLCSLSLKSGTTMIVVMHRLAFARAPVPFVNYGLVAESGPPHEVLASPKPARETSSRLCWVNGPTEI